jgi:outer membrane scaffolding protein for murein synthesis (MipA/OmpV family)
MINTLIRFVCIGFLFLASQSPVFAENVATTPSNDITASTPEEANEPDLPLWEVRLGATALFGPDYPGASDTRVQGIGAPLVIYRGERFRFGEYGGVARAIAAETKRFELDLSLDAAFPASSTDDGLRAGMPDLDFLFQAGPQGIFHLSDTGWTQDGRQQWRFHLPIRAVAATDFQSIDHVGYISEPQLVYQSRKEGKRRSSWSVTLFATLADKGLAEYWYEVPPAFVTPERQRYQASSGYVSTGVRASWTRELTDNFQLFLTYQGRSFAGAANEDSPLLDEDFTHAVSTSFVWKIAQSEKRAKRTK